MGNLIFNWFSIQIREDVKSGVYVENLTEEYVSTMKDVTQLLIKVRVFVLWHSLFVCLSCFDGLLQDSVFKDLEFKLWIWDDA